MHPGQQMLINKVEKKDRLTLLDIVKYQIVTYCYFEKITVSDTAMDCFAHLCINGKTDLNLFCVQMHERNLFASAQVVRNTITKGEDRGLLIKSGNHRKEIEINPALNIQIKGNILLDFKFFHSEST